jgi:RNA polymerase sigma factor (sigma-70 family)
VLIPPGGENSGIFNSGEVVRRRQWFKRPNGLVCWKRLNKNRYIMSSARDSKTEKAIPALTGRERQIIRLVSEGLSNKAIARRLKITDGTVKVHLHTLFEKLGVSNRTALAVIQLRMEKRDHE